MAVSTPTLLTSGGDTTSDNADATTASFAPSANALVVVWVGVTKSSGVPDITISSSHSPALSWSEITAEQGTGSMSGSIFYAQAGSNPGSGTITFSFVTNLVDDAAWIVWEHTGHNTSSPVAQSKLGNNADDNLAITLDSAPVSGSIAVSGIADFGNNNIAPGTNETEIAEIRAGLCTSQTQYSTDQAHNWTNLDGNDQIGIVIEIAEAAAAPTFDLDRIEHKIMRGTGRGLMRGVN